MAKKQTAKLSDKNQKRLEELRGKLLYPNGDYRENADFELLQELAVLEAKADGQPLVQVAGKEKGEPPRARFITGENIEDVAPKKKAPANVKKWLKRGFTYYGVDANGRHILWNKDEGQWYRLNKDCKFVDALGDGLSVEYLANLK